ncbi:MAG TPA: c-type cytochrome [Candidatus Binatia bacterium]|nr:c-type cytochrome [Candidatus Binatia bacterium]
MRGFVLGIIVTLIVVFCGAYYYLTSGYFDIRAVGNTPGSFERQAANKSMDEWVDGHAPKQPNPFQPTMDNIMDGSMTYDKHCAFCHGSLKQPISPMRTNFYPSVPQLMNRTPDDPDSHLFYVIKYGIRYTAMPGWDKVLPDDDIWKTVIFIKNSSQMKDESQQQNPQNPDNSKQPEPQEKK